MDAVRDELHRRGHRVFIFAPEYPNPSPKRPGVFRFPSLNYPKTNYAIPIPFSHKIWTLIPRLKLDLAHAHHPLLMGQLAEHIANKENIPLVYTFHTQLEEYAHYIPFEQKFVKKMARKTLENFCHNSDHVIFPSTQLLETVQNYKFDTERTVIPNAIDTWRFKKKPLSDIRLQYHIPQDHTLFIYIGRIGPEKNLPLLVDAFDLCHKQYPKTHLIFVGEGSELETLQSRAHAQGLEQATTFTGAISYQQIPNYLAAADAFTTASTTEVKPLSILESLASGTPVIGVRACGIQDTVIENTTGWLCQPDNLDDLAQLFKQAASQPQHLKDMKQAALNSAQEYSIQVYVDKLLNLYEQQIQQGRQQK